MRIKKFISGSSLLVGVVAVGLTTVAQAQSSNTDVSRPSNLAGLRTVDFQIERGAIVSSNDFAFIAEILGSQITSGNTPIPVTTQLRAGGDRITPWGSFTNPRQGNVNFAGSRDVYLHPEVLDAGEGVAVEASSYIPRRRGFSRHITASSALQSDFVIALRDGDPLPEIRGFSGQANVVEFLVNYIENGKIRLHENQVIYLFELGTSNLNSAAADFQDLVMIVTLAESLEELDVVVNGPVADYD